jgi:TetR/AcrR family transcriptional regulator
VESAGPKAAGEKDVLILAAARKRFDLYGYAKVTMDEIADDLGMSKASLYYYFPTKEAIFRSVVKREQDEFAARADELLREKVHAPDKLRRYTRFRSELTGRLMLLSRFDPKTRKQIAPIFKELSASFARCELGVIVHIVNEGRMSGDFRTPHPQKTASLILHVLQGLRFRYIMDEALPRAVQSVADELERESLFFIDTLISGMGTGKAKTTERNFLHETE